MPPSIRRLRVVANAGEPDEVLARRIDVVKAAQEWYDAHDSEDYTLHDVADDKLERAVRSYRRALARRQREQGIT